jgi:broad specificity phosphatase PhoE
MTKIHLVRHAESEHNVNKDWSMPDPPLTSHGLEQASDLARKFPHQNEVAIILTSPLRRTIQTALGGFSHILDKRCAIPESNPGIDRGARLIIYPDIQPRADRPCDNGSKRDVLEREFPGLDFSSLKDGWEKKEGAYADTDEAVSERGNNVRHYLAGMVEGLKGKARRDIVLVGHGVVKDFVAGRDKVDWPRAGWISYCLHGDSVDGYQLERIAP